MTEDVRLVKTSRNEVFIIVKASGIEPAHFQWEEVGPLKEWVGNNWVMVKSNKLVHIPSHFYYWFGAYEDEFSPGHQQRIGRENISHESWPSRLQLVTYWLRELKEELDAPDLWAEILQERRLSQIAAASQLENTQFIDQEKQYVIQRLSEIKQHLIAQYQLELDQTKAIEQGFQNIADAMDRLGKKDWVNYAVGFLLNIAAGAVFSPHAANDMLHSFMRAVIPLFDAAMKHLQ